MVTPHFEKTLHRVDLKFPSAIASTNVAEIRDSLNQIVATEDFKQGSWSELHLDLSDKGMVDSMGLNFLFDLATDSANKSYTLTATIGKRIVYMTFLNVRLDKKIKIKEVGVLYQ